MIRHQLAVYSPLPFGALLQALRGRLPNGENPLVVLSELLAKERKAEPVILYGSGTQALQVGIRNYRSRGLCSQLLLALDTPPTLPDNSAARRIRLLSSLDGIEQSFDPIKFGELPKRPSLEIYLPSVAPTDSTPQLAPAGHAVASVMIHYPPYALAGTPEQSGWQQSDRDGLIATVLGMIDASLPGFSQSVVHEIYTRP